LQMYRVNPPIEHTAGGPLRAPLLPAFRIYSHHQLYYSLLMDEQAHITGSPRPYLAFGDYLKDKYGCKVYKVTIDAGFTCPNRDGKLGTGGCIYCNNRGFSPNTRQPRSSVTEQLERGMKFLRQRYKAEKFISYFQAFTNTYAPLEKLEKLYRESLVPEDVVGLSVGTRPDCCGEEVVGLLAELARGHEVWIELGLQSIHDSTLERINRRHDFRSFTDAVERIHSRPGLKICAHVILGLPGETREMMIESAGVLSDLGIEGIKIHLLHVLKDTELERMYEQGEIEMFGFNEYVQLVADYLEKLDPGIVIQRLTADGPSDILVAPRWALEKKRTIDKIEKELLKRGSRQGTKRETRGGTNLAGH